MCDGCGWEQYHKDLDRILDGPWPQRVAWRVEQELGHINDSIEGNKHITASQKYIVDQLVKRANL
ncbi:MAG: hypothetical protein IMZ71_03755 [Chloroflexi bacterium]|nr:hypothetical protein [Chloroflexota bacterium]